MSDNGSNWFIQGTHDDRWDDEELSELKRIEGQNFEVVDITRWLNNPDFDPNSAAVPQDAVALRQEKRQNAAVQVQHVFPNPFSESVQIQYSLAKPSEVSLILYELSGKVLMHNSLNEQAAGHHMHNLDTPNLENGIYYLRIIAVNVLSDPVKLVLLK